MSLRSVTCSHCGQTYVVTGSRCPTCDKPAGIIKPFNPWEAANRLKKVVAIVDYLDCRARDTHFCPHSDAGAIADMLRHAATEAVWQQIAKSAGVIEPGKDAIADIITVYERRALAANDRAVAS
jgi:predicted amidophosphoribosyltransferase